MAVTDAQFLDHANQNNGEFTNRRIVIKGTGAPTGATVARYKSIYIDTDNDNEYVNNGTIASPSWVAYPYLDISGKEDVGAAQTELRASVATAGDTLKKLYDLILSLGAGLSTPLPFDADTATLFPAGVAGDAYIVTVAGTVDTVSLSVGDLFWTDTTTAESAGNYVDWYILEGANDLATETVAGLVELATQAEAEATSSQSNTVVLTALRGWQQIVAWWTNTLSTTGKNLSENDFTDALLTKLNNIETAATADQTGSEIKSLLFALSDTNNFDDTYKGLLDNLFTASEEVTRFDWTISGHSFSEGEPIAFNNDTEAFVLSVSNDTDLQHLGFVTSVSGDDLTISLNGLIDITGWGLAQYTRYYLDTDGSLITSDNGFPILQTISTTKAIIVARGSGAGSSTPTTISQKYTKEVDLTGTTNQITLDHDADTILGVYIDGHIQDDDRYSTAVPVDVTVITLEDTAADLNGRSVKVVYLQNAVLGDDVTVYWSDILEKPFPSQSGYDPSYYVAPIGDGTFGYYPIHSALSPTLQNVTDSGATSTLPITVAGITLSDFNTRTLLYVDTDGSVNQASLASGLSLSAGGELSSSHLPLTGGIITGDLEAQADVYLSGIAAASVSSYRPVYIDPVTGVLSYNNSVVNNLQYVTSIGNTTTYPVICDYIQQSSLDGGGETLAYITDIGRVYRLAIGTNLSLDLVSTVWTLNATGGTGGTVISGTTNKIAKFNGAGNNVIDSNIEDNGTTVGIFTSPIATASLIVAKSNTTTMALLQQLGSSGDALQCKLPTGGGASQNFIKGIYGVSTVRYRVDISGKIYGQNLNLALGASSTLPLLISSSGDVSYGAIDYTSSQISNKPTLHTVATSGDYNDLLNRPTELLQFTVDIGDWNMDASENVAVDFFTPLPIDEQKIRSIQAIIRNDAGNTIYPLDLYSPAHGGQQGGISSIGGSGVELHRLTSGYFDHVNFDSTSFNRGWVTIYYIP